MAPLIYPATKLDSDQVIQYVYDEATQTLRTTATAVIVGQPIEVEIDMATDSIKLGDGTTLFTSTTVGPKTGLDVSIINTIPISGSITVTNFPTTVDTNYGVVGASTLRTASQIGNATGAADFGSGTTSAQTLRVVLPTDQSAISVTQGTSPWVISGTVAATQSGTWNINNISGTISLPTGAATSALQTTGNTSLSSIDSKLNSLGQKVSAASVPVVIASDQSPIAVTGTITTSPDVNIHDGAGNSLTSQVNGAQRALDVGIDVAGVQIDPRQIRALTAADVVTANAGTGNFTVVQATGTNLHTVIDSGTVSVTQSTSPWVISGTVTANQGTSPWVISGTVDQGGAALPGNAWYMRITDGATTAGITAFSLNVNVTNTVPISGTVLVSNLPTTVNTNYGTVGASTIRTASQIGNATGAAAFNAGTTTAQTLRVVLPTDQTAIPVTQSTSPWVVSGTVAATQSGTWTTGRTWTLASGTDSVAAVQSGTWNINNISGTISLPTGASTSALQTTGNTSLASIVTNTNSLILAQGSTTSGQTGNLIMGAVTTAAPAYTTAQTSPLSLTTSGALRTDSSATTQPVSGTVTVSQATASSLNAQVQGPAASGAAKSGNPVQTGAVFNTTQPTVTTGQVVENQATSRGAQIVATGVDNFNINNISGTVSLPTGAATEASLAKLTQTQGSTTSGQSGPLILGAVTTASPTYTTAQSSPLSLDTSGSLRVTGGQVADKTTFTYGTTNFANIGGVFQDTSPSLTAGQSGVVRLTANRAEHVNLRDASGNELLGQKTMAASVPVVIASDQATFPVSITSSTTATYSAAVLGLATGLLATDIFTITGSGTKTVKIKRIGITATRTADAKTDIELIKRSTANSGGTSSSVTAVPLDSNNAAATATVLSYTVNPTLGTTVGAIRTQKQYIPVATSSVLNEVIFWEFGLNTSQPATLRGTSQVLAVNLNGVTITGSSFDIYIEWTEE